jgi:hypothetical protein
MSFSLNLIPDIKKEYLKTQKIKKLSIIICIGVSAISLIILLILGITLLTQSSIKSALSTEIEKNYNAIVQDKDQDGVPSISRLLTIQSAIKSVNDTFTKVPITSRLIDFLHDVNLSAPNAATIERIVFTGGETSGNAFTVSITGSITSYAALDTYKASLQNAKFCSDQDRAAEDVKTCYELEEKLKAKQKELPTLFAAGGVKQKSSSYSSQRDRVSFRMDLTFNKGANNPFAYYTKDKDNKTVRMTGVKAIIESKRASDSAINTPLFDRTVNGENDSTTTTEDAAQSQGGIE